MGNRIYLAEITGNEQPTLARGYPHSSNNGTWLNGVRVPLDPAKTYTFKCKLRRSAGSSGINPYAGVALFDAAEVDITGDGVQWFYAVNGAVPATTFTTYSATFGFGTARPFPGAAVRMAPLLVMASGTFATAIGWHECLEIWIEDNAAPGVPVTEDPYFRNPGAWVRYGNTGDVVYTRLTDEAITRSRTWRFSTGGYVSAAADTPARELYDARLIQPCLLRYDIPHIGAGVSSMGYGEIELANADGALSDMAYHAFDGQQAVIKVGDDEAALSTFETIAQATMEQLVVDRRSARMRLRTPDAILDRPLLRGRYAGTGGMEGPSALAGQLKPVLYGSVAHLEPVCLDTTKHIYQLSAHYQGASATNVYVAGNSIAAGTQYTSQTDMETNAPAAGTYRAWLAGGCFRLGTAPTGLVTCKGDWMYASGSKLQQIAWQIAYDAGVPSAQINGAQNAALSAPDNWGGTWASDEPRLGVYLTDERTAREVLDEVLQGAGAWGGYAEWGGTLLGGALKFGVEHFPPTMASGNQLTYDESEIVSPQAVAPNMPGRGVPVWRVDLEYARNHRTLSPADAPGFNQGSLGLLGIDGLWSRAEDANVPTRHATAVTLTRRTLFNFDNVSAGYEAARQLALHRRVRQWFVVRVPVQAVRDRSATDRPRLGGYVYLSWPELRVVTRDGLVSSRARFLVMGLQIDLARGEVQLTVRQATEQGD